MFLSLKYSCVFMAGICLLALAACKQLSDRYNRGELPGLKGKILVAMPDSIRVFEKGRVIIRIAQQDLDQRVFTRDIPGPMGKTLQDSFRMARVMSVQLRESMNEHKVNIQQRNNNATQFVDSLSYAQWVFDVVPIDYGEIMLVVSVSAKVMTDFGTQERDFPLYEKTIRIYATPGDKMKVYWQKNYVSVSIVLVAVFLLLLKLVPKQVIIDYYMPNSKRTNFWNAGSLGLFIYVITIVSFFAFKAADISLIYVPLVFIGTLLLYIIFTAVSLRDNDKLSEKNFLALMGIALRKVPPLNFFMRDNKSSAIDKK
jgi:hypothetical protein